MTDPGRWVSLSQPYLGPRDPGQHDAWTDQAAQHGRKGTQRLVEVGEVSPPADVASALDIPAGQPVVVRRRVILLDDQPIELTDSYYPLPIARGTALAETRKVKGGAVTLLAELGHAPHTVQEDVTARMPTVDERAALNIGEEPVLVLVRRTLTVGGLPVEVSVATMPARGRHLTYQTTVS